MPFNQSFFNEMMKKKYDILQQEVDDRTKIAQMHYGEGGSVDRQIAGSKDIASMQYGPGGMGDREIAAKAPYLAGLARQANVNADVDEQKLPLILQQLSDVNKFTSELMPGKMEEQKLKLEYFRSLLGDKKKASETGIAKPRTVVPSEMFTSPTQMLDIENSRWKPFGESAGFSNWMARRGRNIAEMPRRMFDSLGVGNWSVWNQ